MSSLYAVYLQCCELCDVLVCRSPGAGVDRHCTGVYLRRTAPGGPPEMATPAHWTFYQHYSCFAIACRSIFAVFLCVFPTSWVWVVWVSRWECQIRDAYSNCGQTKVLCFPMCRNQIVPKKVLIHISLASHFGDIGKLCRPWSDATELGVWSGSSLFANRNIYSK